MIRRLSVVHGQSHDPDTNLAVEELLLHRVERGQCILFLWQNARTVVIGRNQNAWKECRVSVLEQDGGRLARRRSGGGAVYHDLGNLNFTFLVPEEDYDVSRQLSVIQQACRAVGIPVKASGRNDLLAEGRKFSGNAFYRTGGRACHHGTLMVDVDLTLVSRYLSPPRAKLDSKGVDSVRARVVNLRQLCPSLTCEGLAQALEQAFAEVYGGKPEPLGIDALDPAALEALRRHYADDAWRFGVRLPFCFTCEERFDWGGLELCLQADAGRVRSAQVWTDAMDESLAQRLSEALTGVPFSRGALIDAVAAAGLPERIEEDLIRLIMEQEI